MELPNGNIYSVYHHWDGYPEWLGRILKQHYNTDAAVNKLIDGGDMSSCYSDTGWDYDEKRDPQPCYYSERGEDCPPRTDATIQEYFANANSWEEYCYISLHLVSGYALRSPKSTTRTILKSSRQLLYPVRFLQKQQQAWSVHKLAQRGWNSPFFSFIIRTVETIKK